MGAQTSKGKMFQLAARFGDIYLQTDKPTYFGGETVTGRVYLNLLLPYPGNQLYIKLKGKEIVWIVTTKAVDKWVNENGTQVKQTEWVDDLVEEKHNIIKLTVPLYTWGTLMPGQFIIPFSFMLPPALASSFHQEGHRYLANISYQIEAILEPFIKNEPKLKYKQRFVVRQPVNNAAGGHGQEITTPLSACCSSKGSNKLKVNFEKNYYAPGETAQVIMQLDNTGSQIANSRITFSLNQKLKLKAGITSENKDLVKVQRDLPGIPAGGVSSSNLIALNLPAFQGGDFGKIKTFNIVEYLVNLKEDAQKDVLNSATRGKLITSEYSLAVTCPMDGCCSTTPTVTCPIEIYYPEIQIQQVYAPPNWQPQTLDSVQVAFSMPGISMSVGMPNVTMNVDMNNNNMNNGYNNNNNNGQVTMTVNNGYDNGMNGNVTMTTNTTYNDGYGNGSNYQQTTSTEQQNMNFMGMNMDVKVTTTETHSSSHYHS